MTEEYRIIDEPITVLPDDEGLREITESFYTCSHYLIFGCRFPHDVDEILCPVETEPGFIHSHRWRVIRTASQNEINQQIQECGSNFGDSTYYYCCEAMD